MRFVLLALSLVALVAVVSAPAVRDVRLLFQAGVTADGGAASRESAPVEVSIPDAVAIR